MISMGLANLMRRERGGKGARAGDRTQASSPLDRSASPRLLGGEGVISSLLKKSRNVLHSLGVRMS